MKLTKTIVSLFASIALTLGMVACVELEGEEGEEGDEVVETEAAMAYTEEKDEGGVEILKVCECTAWYIRCEHRDGTWSLARGQTCSWSDGSGPCPGSYPPSCSGSGSGTTQTH